MGSPRFQKASLAAALLILVAHSGVARTAEPGPESLDLARVKELEAKEKLQRLEETMDRLATLLAESEPQNAAKLRRAFQESRQRLVLQGMDRVIQYLQERKIDRALEEHKAVRINLEELIAILQEEDVDPREILKHIQRLRDIVKGLDQSLVEQAAEKAAAEEAAAASVGEGLGAKELEQLEDLIQREKEIEKDLSAARERDGEGLDELASRQDGVRRDAEKLEAGGSAEEAKAAAEKAEAGGEESARETEKPAGEAVGQPGEGKTAPGTGRPERILDRKSLRRAAEHMERASAAMRSAEAGRAAEEASDARKALEEAALKSREALERLRAKRDLQKLREEQEATKGRTEDIAKRMEEPPPLVPSPEGAVPGRSDVQSAAGEMGSAADDLRQGAPTKAARAQKKALEALRSGREKVEEALEQLQRAFRDRLLAYLKDKFQRMLTEQRLVSRQTKSLDLKLRALRVASASGSSTGAPEPDREDRQLAQSLSGREERISLLADDVLDVLAEDGTTLVFPGVVEELKKDILGAAALLGRIETGERTQYIQRQIEAAIEDILRAIEEAQRSPPPPDPSQGRNSRSGAGPLLPLSSELRLVRALQVRVNERTRAFDLARPEKELSPESKSELEGIRSRQAEVERMLRKLAQAIGER